MLINDRVFVRLPKILQVIMKILETLKDTLLIGCSIFQLCSVILSRVIENRRLQSFNDMILCWEAELRMIFTTQWLKSVKDFILWSEVCSSISHFQNAILPSADPVASKPISWWYWDENSLKFNIRYFDYFLFWLIYTTGNLPLASIQN